MSTAETALDLATRYRDAFFARDVDAIMALVTPDFVFENVTGGVGATSRRSMRDGPT